MVMSQHRLLTCPKCGDVVGTDSLDTIVLLGRPAITPQPSDREIDVECPSCRSRFILVRWYVMQDLPPADYLTGSEVQ
jgi:hypothetical protein